MRSSPAPDRVHVGVDEARQQHPAAQVDHLRARAGQRLDLGVGADGDDPAVPHRDRLGPGPGRVHLVDGASAQHEIRWCVG